MRLNLTTQPSYPALNPLLPGGEVFALLNGQTRCGIGIGIALKRGRRVRDGSGVLSCFCCRSKVSGSMLLCRWVCH